MKLLALLLLCGYSAATLAQPTFKSQQWTQETVDAARRTIPIILDRIRPNLRPSFQRYADSSKFKVGAYGDFYAYFDPGTGEIHMPFGLWHGFRLISWAYQDANDDPTLLPRVSGYVKFISLRMQDIEPNSAAVLQPDFRSWAGLPARPALSDTEQRRRSAREVEFLVNAMAFILAHELSHLYYGHRLPSEISPAESRDQETLADRSALTLIQKSGFDVVPAAMAMMLLGTTKLTPSGQLIQVPSHPHPFCRVYTTFTATISRQRNDPELIDAIRRAGMPSVEFYIRELLSLKEAC